VSGFLTNPVELIQRILFDGRKTDELLVLKELIQNGDDARANVLHVGLSAGLPDTDHPLLRGPGLYIVNDGPFSERHAKAVRSLGGSSKVEEDAAIGKFGIGLKSVFHLGEVFFFLCRSQDHDDRELHPLARALNPYNNGEAEDNQRPEWDQFSAADRHRMRTHLDALGIIDGFTVWVPLRTRESTRLGDGELSISQYYPGDEPNLDHKIFTPAVYAEISRMLPLMRHLREVHFRSAAGVVTLNAGQSTRSLYPDVPGEHPFQGLVDGGRNVSPLRFGATETLLATTRIEGMQSSEHWPRRMVGGAQRQVRDKTRAHAAVVIKQQPVAHRATLTLQWAVFLPLGHHEQLTIGGQADIHITLHGCFFISADRRNILEWTDAPGGEAETSTQLQQQWNAELARRGTLPLLLPTLRDFTRTFTEEDTDHLSFGLRQSRLFSAHRAELCQRGDWVRTIREGWTLTLPGTRLLEFPHLPALSGTFLSGIEEVSARATLIEARAPHLMAGNPRVWTDAEVQSLLGPVSIQQLDADRLGQLGEILRVVAHPENWSVRRQVLSAVLQSGTERLRSLKSELSSLLLSADPERRFVLPKGLSQMIRERLALLRLDVLLLPGELEVPGEAALSLFDALSLIQTMAGQRNSTETLKRVIDAVPAELQGQLRAAVAQLEIIEVRTLADSDPVYLTPFEAHRRVADGLLFRGTAQTREWAKTVTDAFRDVTLAFTEGTLLVALGGGIDSFGINDLDRLIARKHAFSGVPGRAELLSRMVREDALSQHTPAARAILHGHPDQLQAQGPLYLVDGQLQALERLAGMLLAARGEQWRVVPKALAELLNVPQRTLLNIQPMDAAAVDRLVVQGAQNVVASAFTRDERRHLLTLLHESAARRLPFFEALDGTPVTLSNATVLPGSATLPLALGAQLVFLVDDPAWAEVYRRFAVTRLDTPAAVCRTLRSGRPDQHAQWLLDQLETLDLAGDEAMGLLIAETPWLTTRSGVAVAPLNLIDLPGVADQVARILGEAQGEYLDPGALHEELLAHQSFPLLSKHGLTLGCEDAVDTLAEVMAADPQSRYATGDDDLSFAAWWAVFSDLSAQAFPALGLLTQLHPDQPHLAERLWERLAGRLSTSALRGVLNHVAAKAERQTSLLPLHAHYMHSVVEQDGWGAVRSGLRLRSQRNRWRPVGELCLHAEGVDAQDLLHDEHVLQLGDLVLPKPLPPALTEGSKGAGSVGGALTTAPATLEKYFLPWEGLVERELIGAFLSLLGGDPRVEDLARRYLGVRPLGIVRSIVATTNLPRGFSTFEEMIDAYRVTAEVSKHDRVQVMSLLDEPIEVRKASARASVVVGQPEPGRRHEDIYYSPVILSALNLAQHTPQELSAALLAATRAVLRGMYFVKDDELDTLWADLARSDQFDLRYTQQIITEDSISYIRNQLNLPGKHRLNALFQQWEAARRAQVEEKYNPNIRGRNKAGQEIEALRAELQGFLETETDEVISKLLEAVRRRVSEAQYQASSVPFEVLQNADDALEELQVMREGQSVTPTFVIRSAKQSLSFMHWGRAINQFALGRFDGEARGFKGDLIKMLTLSASDKGASDLEVTGKFGMGFKSVYLLAQRPQVVSGRLAFEVIGGVYPKQLGADHALALRDDLERYGDRNLGTLIRLDVHDQEAHDALADFRAWLPLTLVFARHIKQVIDVTPQGQRAVTWHNVPLGNSGWSVGSVEPLHPVLERGLVCQLPNGTLLLQLSARGVTALPDTVPNLWVTAPTRSFAHTGVAVNAMFSLDIGRSEVASKDPGNLALAQQLGLDLAVALQNLYAQSLNWPDFMQALALAADTTAFDFWSRLWHVLAERVDSAPATFSASLMREMLWGSARSGLRALIEEREVLPTGLWNDHLGLTSLPRVTHQVSGALARERVFQQFVDTSPLILNFPPGTLIHEVQARRIEHLTAGACSFPELTVLRLLKLEFGDHPEVTPELAVRLAASFPKATLDTYGDERMEVQEYLATFRFQNIDGQYVRSQELLVGQERPQVEPDEPMRAAFAPRARQLHAGYGPEATEFFLLSRGGLRADAKALAQWVADARDPVKQAAVVAYLLHGSRTETLVRELELAPATWLADILAHPAFLKLDTNSQHLLAGRLKVGHDYSKQIAASGTRAPEPPEPVRLEPDPGAHLELLYQNWLVSGPAVTAEFERRTYPPYMRPHGQLLELGTDRKRWLTVLMLGTYQSLGRTTREQTRDFLQRAEDRGWMDVFAAETVEPDRWFAILDAYLQTGLGSGSQEYYHWFSRFLATYQLSRHLDTYITVLSGLDRLPGPVGLDAILNPSTSDLFTGSGIDAPALQRSLGLGRHFVVRELLRTGAVRTRHLDTEAFMPSKAVRQRFAELGCPVEVASSSPADSRVMHTFLARHLGEARATFHGAFDLPFQQDLYS